MLDDIQDSLSNKLNSKEDNNSIIGNRVKKHQLLPGWLSFVDNHCRTLPKSSILFQNIRIYVIIILLSLIQYNLFVIGDMTIFKMYHSLEYELTTLSLSIIDIFANSWVDRYNIIITQFELLNYFDIKEPLKLEYDELPLFIVVYMWFILLILVLNLISNTYTYFIQRNILAASITHLYVPKIFQYFFYYRDTNHYFYVRLLHNQKNQNLYKSISPMVLSNFFNLDHIEDISKIEIKLTPRKLLFGFYDYIEISYLLEDLSSSKTLKKEDTKKIDKIKDRIDEVKESIENNNVSDLELLDLEGLESMNI